MKYRLSLSFCLFISFFSPMFANEEQSRLCQQFDGCIASSEKIYINPEDVLIAEDGIFVPAGDDTYPVL
ncbi:MAG: hypothetical protein WB791_09765 [Waddliaceae bacterium]